MINNLVNVGVIGAGIFAQNNHIPCLLANKSIKVSWVADLDPRRLKIIGSMYSVTTINSSKVDSCLEGVDVVLLTTPYGTRELYYKLLSKLDRIVHVYIEKPFARSISEHERITAYFKKNTITVGFNRRYYKNYKIIKKVLSDRMFGDLKSVTISQGFFSLTGMSGFREVSQLSGGGVLIESGIHLIDTALSAIGATDIFFDKVKMLENNGIDYHTEAVGKIYKDYFCCPINIKISSISNFMSGIWLEFEGVHLHYPMLPEEKVTFRDHENKNIGVLELDVDGATSTSESLQLAWRNCLNGLSNSSALEVTGDNSRRTSKALGLLYSSNS